MIKGSGGCFSCQAGWLNGTAARRRFTPCEWADLACHALVDIAAASRTQLPGIVGHHKNAGIWLKSYEAAAVPLPLARRLRSAGAVPFIIAGATAAVLLLLALVLLRRRRLGWLASCGRRGVGRLRLLWPGGVGDRLGPCTEGHRGAWVRRDGLRGSGAVATRRLLPPPVSAAAVAAACDLGLPVGASGWARHSRATLPRPGSAGQLGGAVPARPRA